MIVNLRGANGSGKSTVAHSFIKQSVACQVVPLASYSTPTGAARAVTGYWLKDMDIIIVGAYRTQCGGCDGIKTQDLVCESVRLARQICANVLFEGVIVSTLFQRYADLARELNPKEFIFAYLNTPLKTCLARIQKRNCGKTIKEDLVADKVKAIHSTMLKANAEGLRIAIVRHNRALADVTSLLYTGDYQ